MATRGYQKGDEHSSDGIYRCVGTLTITRAATTERELDLMPENMTIDVSGVQKMDTVGAWLIHRLARDKDAEVVGLDEDHALLLDKVAHSDQQVKVRPDRTPPLYRVLGEVGEATMVAVRSLVGLLAFFGALLISKGILILRGQVMVHLLLVSGLGVSPVELRCHSIVNHNAGVYISNKK